MKITRIKNKSRLKEVVSKMQALHNNSAEIGFFSDSGIHTLANMSFASLAFLHAFPLSGYHHTRNWLEHTKPMKGNKKDTQVIRTALEGFMQLDSKETAGDVLMSIGRSYNQRAKAVFGNSAMLIVSNNPTPLVDTGELKAHVGYKTTLDYTLRFY